MLWQTLCEDFLRLAEPSSTDQTRSRWPNHPVWDAIGAAFLVAGLNEGKLSRFTAARPPRDDRLFLHGLAGLSSFMAREGITDLGEALGAYLHHAEAFHQAREPGGMEAYLVKKAAVKGKRYNTQRNGYRDEELVALKEQAAQAYRKAKEEGDG